MAIVNGVLAWWNVERAIIKCASVVQSLDLRLLAVGEQLFGRDRDGLGGEFVGVMEQTHFGHDVVFEGKSGVGDVSVRLCRFGVEMTTVSKGAAGQKVAR